MNRIAGWGLVGLGIAVVVVGTLTVYGGGLATVTAGSVILASGSLFVGRALRWDRDRRLLAVGAVVALIGVTLSAWGFTGSFAHDEYPAFGGIAVIGIGACITGAGIGRRRSSAPGADSRLG